MLKNTTIPGSDVVPEAPKETLPASDAPSRTPVPGIGPPPGEQIIRRCGRFTLVRGEQGFWWLLTSHRGSVWYWHAEVGQWLGRCRFYHTEEQATAGLGETLAHEPAGDLGERPALHTLPAPRDVAPREAKNGTGAPTLP